MKSPEGFAGLGHEDSTYHWKPLPCLSFADAGKPLHLSNVLETECAAWHDRIPVRCVDWSPEVTLPDASATD